MREGSGGEEAVGAWVGYAPRGEGEVGGDIEGGGGGDEEEGGGRGGGCGDGGGGEWAVCFEEVGDF